MPTYTESFAVVAHAMLDMARCKGFADHPTIEAFTMAHLEWMLDHMMANQYQADWPDAKMGRWLGWIQAACVLGTNGAVTLEDCKIISRKYFAVEAEG